MWGQGLRIVRSYVYSPHAELALSINSMHPSVEFRQLPDLPGNVYDGTRARAALGGDRRALDPTKSCVVLFKIGLCTAVTIRVSVSAAE